MGATPRGLPWPEQTAFVVDGDDAIRALAEATDTQLSTAEDAADLLRTDLTAEAAARAAADTALDNAKISRAIIDAAGDLLVGTGPDTVDRLGKGGEGTVLSVVGGALAWAAAGVPGWVAGTDVLYTDNTTSNAAPYAAGVNAGTKVREVVLGNAGALRIVFSGIATAGGFTAQIRRNGVAVGTLRTVTGTAGTQFSEDIAGWAYGDLLQIYMTATGAAGNTASVNALSLRVQTIPLQAAKRL